MADTQMQQPPAQPTNQIQVLQTQLDLKRKDLVTLWASKHEEKQVRGLCSQRWDGWSAAVRSEFLKRSQNAVIAAIQTTIPKKQWAQYVQFP
jgi:hypothetical protein